MQNYLGSVQGKHNYLFNFPLFFAQKIHSPVAGLKNFYNFVRANFRVTVKIFWRQHWDMKFLIGGAYHNSAEHRMCSIFFYFQNHYTLLGSCWVSESSLTDYRAQTSERLMEYTNSSSQGSTVHSLIEIFNLNYCQML